MSNLHLSYPLTCPLRAMQIPPPWVQQWRLCPTQMPRSQGQQYEPGRTTYRRWRKRWCDMTPGGASTLSWLGSMSARISPWVVPIDHLLFWPYIIIPVLSSRTSLSNPSNRLIVILSKWSGNNHCTFWSGNWLTIKALALPTHYKDKMAINRQLVQLIPDKIEIEVDLENQTREYMHPQCSQETSLLTSLCTLCTISHPYALGQHQIWQNILFA